MKLYVLFGQRKESYEGEYGLEALECMSEADYESNAEFIEKSFEKQVAGNEFKYLAILTFDVNEGDIRRQLNPTFLPIPAAVLANIKPDKEG